MIVLVEDTNQATIRSIFLEVMVADHTVFNLNFGIYCCLDPKYLMMALSPAGTRPAAPLSIPGQ